MIDLAIIQLNDRIVTGNDIALKVKDIRYVVADGKAGGCADIHCYGGQVYYVVETTTQVHDAIETRWTEYLTALTGV